MFLNVTLLLNTPATKAIDDILNYPFKGSYVNIINALVGIKTLKMFDHLLCQYKYR
jgi:hypothetical protein